MSSCRQGYDEERFATTVNRNFLCLICFNVLKDPIECPKNQHCFCRTCITKHLENSQRCPTCADKLTVETLTEPHRMVKDYLNELNIRCEYVNRGCQEIVQLQHLDRHEAACGFAPVVCTNQGCGETLNKRDLIHHESELCEFRKLKCHSCGEMAKTLADLEKRMENVEKNMARNQSVTEAKLTDMEKNISKNIERKTEQSMVEMKADMEEKITMVSKDTVSGLKAALVKSFNEMKEVLVKTNDIKEKITKPTRPAASGDKEKYIIVAGGGKTDSVQMFNWSQKLWSPLDSLPEKRHGATSFVYNNHFTIAGGNRVKSGMFDNMIRMGINPNPDDSQPWSEGPVKLPATMAYHSCALLDDQLIVSGGKNEGATSDWIHQLQLVYPYTVKTLSRMPEPRRGHSMEIFDNNLLIIGGRRTERYQDNLNSAIVYDVIKNEFRQLAPLPYEVSQMATVRWGENIIVIGGVDKEGNVLDKVFIYNVKTEQHYMLPSMRCKRRACAAVVIGNNIVVLGGSNWLGTQKSVESFNFDRYNWEELPDMCVGRYLPTAVAV